MAQIPSSLRPHRAFHYRHSADSLVFLYSRLALDPDAGNTLRHWRWHFVCTGPYVPRRMVRQAKGVSFWGHDGKRYINAHPF